MNIVKQTLITLTLIINIVFSQTQFSGHISENVTWDSDMLITGDVWIDDLATLSIQPGVTVYFVRVDSNQDGIGDTDFFVNGQLVTNGVTFTSYEASPQNTDWGGIDYLTASDGQNSTLYNTQIFYAHEGLLIDGHFMTLNNLEIAGSNQYGLHIQNSSSTTSLTNVNLVDNGTYGMEIVNGDVSINGGLIFGNSSYGLKAHSGANLDINGLISSSNGSYGLWLTGGNSNTTINTVQSVSNAGYGLLIENKDNATISNSAFSNNSAEGGYIEESSNNISFNYCNIEDNVNGGINIKDGSQVTVLHSNILNNSGTGLSVSDNSQVTINYCNFEDNFSGGTSGSPIELSINESVGNGSILDLYQSGCNGNWKSSQSGNLDVFSLYGGKVETVQFRIRSDVDYCSNSDERKFKFFNEQGTELWSMHTGCTNCGFDETHTLNTNLTTGFYIYQEHTYHDWIHVWIESMTIWYYPSGLIQMGSNNSTSSVVDAQYNWWGTISGIDDIISQNISGTINYDDFAISSILGNGATFANLEPEFSFTAPTITEDDPESITFQWVDMDVDDDATISLHYTDGITSGTIVSGISEDDDSDDSYTWNLDGVPYGIYTVYADIDDGSNDVVSVTLDVPVMVGPLSIIVPSDLSAPAGATFTVPIELVNPLEEDNILSFSFSLGYDFTLITALEASSASTLTDGWAITYDINLGQLFISGYTIDAPLTERGVLINLMFLANEDAANLTVANLNIFDAYLNDDAVPKLIDGTFQVINEFEFSGRLKYYNSQNENGLSEATITLINEEDLSLDSFTEDDGSFEFLNVPTDSYSVSISHNTGICNETISMYDASLVAQFQAQMISFDADQMVAADVNGQNGVTVYDAALIAQYVVQNTDSFDAGSWNIPSTGPYYIDDNFQGEEIMAIAIGDPSGNWEPCEDLDRNNDELMVTASKGEVISIIFNYEEPFQSFQSSVQYNNEKMGIHGFYTDSKLEAFTTLTNDKLGSYNYGGFGLDKLLVEDNIMVLYLVCNEDIDNEPILVEAFFDEKLGYVSVDLSQTILGDLNLDYSLDVLDIVMLVNYILDVIAIDDSSLADLNSDGEIDILDIVALMEVVMNEQWMSRENESVIIEQSSNKLIFEGGGSVVLHIFLEHKNNLDIDFTQNSYLSQFNTSGNTTEIIIVSPQNGVLFVTDDEFNILGIEAASTDGYIDVEINKLPTQFNISRVYPNPFNPVTNINFEIAKSGFYKLIIMDINGGIIDILGDSYIDQGKYEKSWDAEGFASGMYFVQLYFNDQLVNSNKLMLIK